MKTPEHLKYTQSHEWIKQEEDGQITVGITDHAQEALGDIVFIELPAVGKAVTAGQECAVVESVKAASDIYAPMSGTVTAINTQICDTPEKINQDAYASWLFKITPNQLSEYTQLLDAQHYAQSSSK
jgi:glycine cleavage system H protein